MIARLVAICLRKRWLIVAVFLMIGAFGVYSWKQLSIEAYPDISDTTAQVVTQYLGHAAEEVEEQVTIPLERALNGIPGLHVMRSKSTFGLSLITLVFVDGVDDYFARQRIRERISGVDLPPDASPDLDPLTSPIGEIYRYTLERRPALECKKDGKTTATLPEGAPVGQRELKELQEWKVVPTLRQIYGIADVTNFGGETTQFQLLVDPARLAEYNLSLKQVTDAIESNNANAGGSVIVRGDQGLVVRGIGLIRSLEDLGNIVVTQKAGTPVFLKNLGELRLGALERRGVLGKDHNPDGVSGIVLLLRGVNPSVVLDGVHEKVSQLNTTCEDGKIHHGLIGDDVWVVPYLDRTQLVHTTLHTVSHTLLEGISLVVLAMLLFLGSPRAALIAGLTIPLSLLIAFILMNLTNIPANLLSLGAIDFGIIVDAAVVVIENVLRHREENPGIEMTEDDAREAATQVARPIFFAKIIIITAYLPLFAFQRVEKKLFAPMAYAVGFALIGATILALVLIPGLAYEAYKKPRKIFHNKPVEWLRRQYDAVLRSVTKRPVLWVLPGVAATAVAIVLGGAVGKSFLPELDEGSIWLQVQLPPGISLQKGSEMADEIRKATLEFKPEVSTIVTQLGRNDDGTDPWTPSHIEAAVGLTAYSTWPNGETKHDLIARMAKRFDKIPGITVGFSQPMIDGVNDKISGAHSELVLKVYGHELGEARRIAQDIVTTLGHVPGSADVAIDQEPPLPQIQIHVNREQAARFGINVADIAHLIEVAVGGRAVAQLFLGERRYDIAVRLAEGARNTPDKIGDLTIQAAGNTRIPLSQLATIDITAGESTITREMNRRHLTVKINIRGRDLSSFLDDARTQIDKDVKYDHENYELVWGGQFENQQRAQARLALVVPVVLGLIFLLLYGAFATLRHAAIVLANVPLALLGGMAALCLRGMTLNVSSAVGFIALFGVSVQNGVILVSNLNRLRDSGAALADAVRQGAGERFRPVLMTAAVAALGMVPAALQTGIGSDVQRPLATVVVGGLITATVLSVFVLPAIYLVVEGWVQRRHAAWSKKERP